MSLSAKAECRWLSRLCGRDRPPLAALGKILRRRGVLSETNSSSYLHTVAGRRQSEPDPETVGGILADEMGLGKTLTMLASIVDSITDACVFAAAPPGLRAERRVKCTLVVVPSVRMYACINISPVLTC